MTKSSYINEMVYKNSGDNTDRLLWSLIYFLGSSKTTVTQKTVGTEPVLLVGANDARKGFSIYNASVSKDVCICCTPVASEKTVFQVLPKNGTTPIINFYRGEISAYRASGSDSVIVTEFT